MKKLYLIDGTALIYRSFYAFIRNPLRNRAGENTSAIFGVINSFLKLLQDQQVEYAIISFDLKEETFRHQIDESYKANRPPAPDELVSQIEPVKEFFKTIKIPEISIAGYEADDILGTLSKRYEDKFEVILVTGDKDFSQLLGGKVRIYDPFGEKYVTAETVKEKYGVTPEQFIDYLALVGDTSDNIPGVRGVGPKTAAPLLQEYTDLDNIYANLDKITSKSLKNKLETGKEDAYLSKELSTIMVDIPLESEVGVDLQELASKAKFDSTDFENLIPFLEKYEFRSLVSKVKQLFTADQVVESKPTQMSLSFYEETTKFSLNYEIIDTAEKLDTLFTNISDKKIIAIDTETTSLEFIEADLVAISLSVEDGRGFYLPLGHSEGVNLPLDRVLDKLNSLPEDVIFVGHNCKYDYLILAKYGFKLREPIFDTMLASYILDSTHLRHSLEACAKRELNYDMIPLSDLIGSGKSAISFADVPLKRAAEYSAEDAIVTFQLYSSYKDRIKRESLEPLYYQIEIPLLFVLAEMERDGVYIDSSILSEIDIKITEDLEVLAGSIYQEAGSEFNINSTQQLSKVLFEDLGIQPLKKIKSGYSTDNSVLEKLSEEYDIAKFLIDYRQLSKLKSTYIDSLPQLINQKTGRLHSSFNQTVVSTGRLSSTNPNLQNIPIKNKAGKEIRKAFTTQDDDYLILAADYSQIELRILGIMSKDRNLIAAFNNNQDIHAQTAGLILNKPITLIDSDERRMAKAINFGLLYGMGPRKLAKDNNITLDQAKEFIDVYFKKFPQIRDFFDYQIRVARSKGYAETIMGRRLYLPNLRSAHPMLKSESERVAINMPIQGSAADIIKMAMIRLEKSFTQLNSEYDYPLVRMIIQVHDELVFEVHKNALDRVKEIVDREMRYALPERYRIIIPLTVDIGVGKNWLEAH